MAGDKVSILHQIITILKADTDKLRGLFDFNPGVASGVRDLRAENKRPVRARRDIGQNDDLESRRSYGFFGHGQKMGTLAPGKHRAEAGKAGASVQGWNSFFIFDKGSARRKVWKPARAGVNTTFARCSGLTGRLPRGFRNRPAPMPDRPPAKCSI